jgi:methionine-S-sulfoxide reductase
MEKEILTFVGLFLLLGLGLAFAEGNGTRSSGDDGKLQKATFAGGCFWCMEPPFDKLDGVVSTTSGYTGGKEENPAYTAVASGSTGHAEAIQVLFDPEKVSYEELLEAFWQNIDPTQKDGQFVDRGRQYRTAIFYHNEDQKRLALASKAGIEKSGRFRGAIVTEIVPAGPFYRAEDYHQDYYKKNPFRYKQYRMGSGRDHFLDGTWNRSK